LYDLTIRQTVYIWLVHENINISQNQNSRWHHRLIKFVAPRQVAIRNQENHSNSALFYNLWWQI